MKLFTVLLLVMSAGRSFPKRITYSPEQELEHMESQNLNFSCSSLLHNLFKLKKNDKFKQTNKQTNIQTNKKANKTNQKKCGALS